MLEIHELGFGYRNNAHRFSKSLRPGELYFVLGANGSGKTSLLKTLGGLLKPLTGTIKYGKDKHPLYVPAYPEVTDWLTGHDIFQIFCDQKNSWQKDEDIQNLEIESLLSRPIHQLSLGEQKRIFLAAAIRTDSEILLLDEPLNSLDWNMEFALEKIFLRHLRMGRTFVTAAHQLQWITRFKTSTVWFIQDFGFLKTGGAEEVLTSTEVQKVFNFRVSFTDNLLDGSRLIATSKQIE